MISSVLNPLKRRIMNMVVRAKVSAVDASKKLPKLRVTMLSGEDATGIEYFQHYGFASKPKPGAEAIIIFVGGNRDHGLAIAAEEREKRLQDLEAGEVALYHPDTGSFIKMKDGGGVEIEATTIALKNATDDLVALLSDTLGALELAMTNTAMGPQPLTNVATFTALKLKVDAFKE